MTEAAGGRSGRAAQATRRALVEAAVGVFAEHGFEAASVRDITGKAKVNQGAITYHFGGKAGLYREVLRAVRQTLGAQPLLTLDTLPLHAPEQAVELFIRQTLEPLAHGAQFRRSLRIFAWEQLKPTAIREKLSREEPFPTVVLAHALVRRFLPSADARTHAIGAAWLLGQTMTFIRDAEWLRGPPFDLTLGKTDIDGLAQVLTLLCVKGLGTCMECNVPAGTRGLAASSPQGHIPPA